VPLPGRRRERLFTTDGQGQLDPAHQGVQVGRLAQVARAERGRVEGVARAKHDLAAARRQDRADRVAVLERFDQFLVTDVAEEDRGEDRLQGRGVPL